MRKAARIVEAMHQRILEKAEPGIRKCDLVAEIYDVGIRGVSETGGDYPAIVPLLPSGPDAAAPHLTGTTSPLAQGRGDIFRDCGLREPLSLPALAHGLPRQAAPGLPGCGEGGAGRQWKRGLENARPGMTCEDIAFGFFSVLERHGIIKDNRTGYSIGLSYPPDWGERTMSLRSGDRTRARTGHDLPFHEWAVAGRYGAGDHREHPDHRNRGRMPRQCATRTLHQD